MKAHGRSKWVCRKCGAEMTHDPDRMNPLRMFRPANACERFPHRWEKIEDVKDVSP